MIGLLEAVEQEEKRCDEVETIREFTYLGDRVSASGGCGVAVTARTRCGWAMYRECGEWQDGKLITSAYKSHLRPEIPRWREHVA